MSPLLLPAILALVLPFASQEPDSSDWPCWRGPARDGISRETEWSSEGAEQPLWRAEVGPGYSNVTIAGGRLYTQGFDLERSQDRVVCLDVRTGAEQWGFGWPEELRDQYHGGGTNSTPTAHGGVVYVLGRSGQAFALDAESGAVQWQRDYRTELEFPQATYGFAASPVVGTGPGGDGDAIWLTLGTLALCVRAADGEVLWHVKLGERAAYTTPVPFVRDGRALLTNFSAEAFLVQDAATGEIRYTFPFRGESGSLHACTPIVAGDDVFLSSAFDVGAVRIRLGDREEPEVVWRTRAMRNKVSGCTLKDGSVYGFDESMLKCLDFATGEERWRVRGLGMGAVAVAGERLIVLDSSGELIVAPASPDGFTELSRRKVLDGGVYWTTPVLLDGRIFVRNSLGSLACLDHRPAAVARRGEGATQAGTPALPSVTDLVQGHAAARSKGVDLAQRSAVHLVGTWESRGAGVPPTAATLDRTSDGRWRLEWDLGEIGHARRVCDGELAWQEDPFYGTFLFEGAALREALETGGLGGPLAGLEDREDLAEARVTGLERFDERDCWRVEVAGEAGVRRTLFFDAVTGLFAGRSAPDEAMVVLADWRAFDGVLLPARTTTLQPDTGAEEVFVAESALWGPPDEALFARPDWIARALRTPEEVAADAERLRTEYASLLGSYRGEEGPERAFEVVEGALALTGGGEPDFVREPDVEGRLWLESLPMAWLVFELDEEGRATVLHIEGLPGGKTIVCPRVDG